MNRELTYVLLPTENNSNIYQSKTSLDKSLKVSLSKEPSTDYTINYFLYILSNDEIKENDWFVNMDFKDTWKVSKLTGGKLPSEINCKKIISTTNTGLMVPDNRKDGSGLVVDVISSRSLPYILHSDIEYIISLYNKKGEVDVRQLAADSGSDESGCIGFVEGFNKCSELNADKKFTLEDMRNMGEYIWKWITDNRKDGSRTLDDAMNVFIHFLISSQPKRDTIMVEYEEINMPSQGHGTVSHVKIKLKLKDGCIVIVR